MAPKEPRQRMDSSRNWDDSEAAAKKASEGKQLQVTDMDLAVMRMRAAAYAIKNENAEQSPTVMRRAALQHVRDAMLIAMGCFSEEEKDEAVFHAQPVTRNGVTQLEPTHVTKVTTRVVTEYKVLFSPWTWIKLKLLGRPTVETTTRNSTQSFNEVRGL